MGNATIFYSWQNQRPPKANRFLIRDALEAALQQLAQDESRPLAFALEQDARGAAGAAEISAVLLQKIADCAIFIADITPVGTLISSKSTLNPNVLFELGYAWRGLGPGRILLVLNGEFGEPEEMPFDISKRHLVRYRFTDEQRDRSAAVRALAGRLAEEIRTIAADDEWRRLREAGLEQRDIELFAAVYQEFIARDADRCSFDDLVELGKKLGMDETTAEEAVIVIAGHGLWNAPEFISPRRFHHIVANPVGLDHYLAARYPRLQGVADEVGRLVVKGVRSGRAIAAEVKQPQIVVDHLLKVLASNDYIKISEDSVGINVWDVLPKLKRAYRD